METQVGISVERINRLDGTGNLKAFCDVLIADAFVIKGIRVVEGKKGLFVGMPREQGKDGNWYETVIPVTKEAKGWVSDAVLKVYHAQIQEDQTIG